MDPNETLAQIRAVIADGYVPDDGADCRHALDLVDALDGWLSKGGFLPEAWQQAVPLGQLTSNDHILTRAGVDLDDPYGLPYVLGVHLDLTSATPVFVRLRPKDRKAVVNLGTLHAEVALYLDEVQISRLITVLVHTRVRLCQPAGR